MKKKYALKIKRRQDVNETFEKWAWVLLGIG